MVIRLETEMNELQVCSSAAPETGEPHPPHTPFGEAEGRKSKQKLEGQWEGCCQPERDRVIQSQSLVQQLDVRHVCLTFSASHLTDAIGRKRKMLIQS